MLSLQNSLNLSSITMMRSLTLEPDATIYLSQKDIPLIRMNFFKVLKNQKGPNYNIDKDIDFPLLGDISLDLDDYYDHDGFKSEQEKRTKSSFKVVGGTEHVNDQTPECDEIDQTFQPLSDDFIPYPFSINNVVPVVYAKLSPLGIEFSKYVKSKPLSIIKSEMKK